MEGVCEDGVGALAWRGVEPPTPRRGAATRRRAGDRDGHATGGDSAGRLETAATGWGKGRRWAVGGAEARGAGGDLFRLAEWFPF